MSMQKWRGRGARGKGKRTSKLNIYIYIDRKTDSIRQLLGN